MTARSKAARTALVTGGNRGLGLATCRELAHRGLRVLLASRGDSGIAAARALADQGLAVEHRRLDVADAADPSRLAAELEQDGVRLDVLVNNAGIALDGFDAEVAKRTLEVNFFGAMRVTDALLPRMAGAACIVMVSSGLGEVSSLARPLREAMLDAHLDRAALVEQMRSFLRDVERGRHAEAGWPSSAYGVSKVGLNALVRVLARELAARRIVVNAVCPGWVRTDMGGRSAPRTIEEGAASIVWAAMLEGGPTGGFFRDGQRVAW